MFICSQCGETINEPWIDYTCKSCDRPLCEECYEDYEECDDCFCYRIENMMNE